MRVVVIGGGVVGTLSAWYLAGDGHAVTLLERAPTLAAEGSHANGGMLHASHGEPWNSPQALRQFGRWAGREDSPLLLRPSRLPHMLGWSLSFLRNSSAARHRASTLANTRLARYSLDLMRALRAEQTLHYDNAARGIAKLYWQHSALTEGLHGAELTGELGVAFQHWSVDELIAHEPALTEVAPSLAGALFFPEDETGDTCSFTQGLGERCRELGVDLRTGVSATGLVRSGRRISAVESTAGELEADLVVLATGAETGLARKLGLKLPLEPVKGYSITVDGHGVDGLPRLPLIDDFHKIVLTPLGERLRLAGTAEFAGFNTMVNPRRVQLLLRQLGALLPARHEALAAAPRTQWACLRPMSPDGVPIVGESWLENLWLNVGAGHMGWTLAAGMGKLLADLIAGRPPAVEPGDYALSRPSLRRLG